MYFCPPKTDVVPPPRLSRCASPGAARRESKASGSIEQRCGLVGRRHVPQDAVNSSERTAAHQGHRPLSPNPCGPFRVGRASTPPSNVPPPILPHRIPQMTRSKGAARGPGNRSDGLERSQVEKAATSLLAWLGKQRAAGDDLLAADDGHDDLIYLTLSLAKVPEAKPRDKPRVLPLPHPIWTMGAGGSAPSVFLVTKDEVKASAERRAERVAAGLSARGTTRPSTSQGKGAGSVRARAQARREEPPPSEEQ